MPDLPLFDSSISANEICPSTGGRVGVSDFVGVGLGVGFFVGTGVGDGVGVWVGCGVGVGEEVAVGKGVAVISLVGGGSEAEESGASTAHADSKHSMTRASASTRNFNLFTSITSKNQWVYIINEFAEFYHRK